MLDASTAASNGAHLKERLPAIADADKWDKRRLMSRIAVGSPAEPAA